MQEQDLSLPSAEYKVTFSDETVTPVSVHPDESLEKSLGEMLGASGKTAEAVASVELLRTYNLETEHPEYLE